MTPPDERTPIEQPRTIKPRKRQYLARPIIAIHGEVTLDEDGNLGTVADLITALPTMRPTLFAMVGAADFVGRLNATFMLSDTADKWQWRASTYERDIVRPDGVRIAARINVVIHYFGWYRQNYHKIIDPVVMYGRKLDTVWPGNDHAVQRLMKWAQALQTFCQNNGIDIRPTNGGISAQFLTDPRFYPKARRKVPARTNAVVREQLPGNYYVLNVHPQPGREYMAQYIDQHRAHHYHARTISLPNADHLYAYGRFGDLANPVFETTWRDFYGLYCLDLSRGVRTGRGEGRSFQWTGRGDSTYLGTEHELTKQFVYSNELPHLLDMGWRVTGVRAAWGSRHKDTGLGKYAQWCEEQLDQYADAPWLKPLLLSAYGVLATRPKIAESVFRLAKAGTVATVPTGHYQLGGYHTKGKLKLEPRIANVIHRGMIEAATRSESVGLAQYLSARGNQILSIYADAVIVTVEDDRPLPPLPEPWRIKRTLNHLQFLNQQAFISGEMTKLPGVTGELRQYAVKSGGRSPRTAIDSLGISYNPFARSR